MSDLPTNASRLAISVALCLDGDAFDRLGAVLRHLVVGLVDQAIQVRLLSADPRVESLKLGPIQTLVHRRIMWPMVGRRIDHLLEALSHEPPTVVHAVSAGSYRPAEAIAEAFDTDLVIQITSAGDCDATEQLDGSRIGKFIALSRPLMAMLGTQLNIPSDRIELIRPGVRVSPEITCFASPQRGATILCTSAFEPGGGVDKLIEALGILHAHDHRPLLFLVGRGRDESSLRRLAREKGLSAHITFAHALGDMTQAMSSADIFVHPSVEPALSVSGLQAMGAGMAVVTFPHEVCDYYRHDETAVVCEDATPSALADAIDQLLADRDRARRIATAAREYARTHHAMSDMAERTAGVYRRLALHRATFSI